jgi:hypothetical protein
MFVITEQFFKKGKNMVKCFRIYVFFMYSLALCLLLSCASASKGIGNLDYPSDAGSGGKGLRLVVLQPKGVNIPKNQEWFLSIVQGSLTNDFNKFSKMTVLDRQHLDDILAEQKIQTSGSFSDTDYVKIGHLTNAQYILVGSLTKTSTNFFMLDLAITNAETGERLASFGPKQYTISDIQGMFAAKAAAYELMLQTGVQFTETGKQRLYETAQSSVSAETVLAKGIVAEKSGATLVEVMQYYYQAIDYDAKITEAIQRLAETNRKLAKISQALTVVQTGNIRKDAQAEIAAYKVEQENKRIDAENKKVWLKQLSDCEAYFADFFKNANAPLALVYSTDIKPVGGIDMQNETMALQFKATLMPLRTSWFRAAQQTVETIRKGLVETGRAQDWGLADWPKKSVLPSTPFSNERREYHISAQLLDEHDTVIGTTNFTLSGGWDCSVSNKNAVGFDVFYERKFGNVVFDAVKVSRITDVLSIRISKINSIDAETAAENGVLEITSDTERMRQAQNQISRYKTAAYFSNLWSDRWYSVGAYWDVYLIGLSYLNHKTEDGYYILNGNDKELLHGGKFGMELGLRHFVMGAYFAIAGYGKSFFSEYSNSNKRVGSLSIDGGFGLGGDFSIGYSFFSPEAGSFSSGMSQDVNGVRTVSNVTIGPGITVLNFSKNPLNAPTIFPYLQLNIILAWLGFGVKLELPVIDGEVTPKIGLDIGLGWTWTAKRK